MTNRRDRTQAPADDLNGWEKWPLAALFLANALNIFILYVPIEEMPPQIQAIMPWVKVACGLAAAASLEGTLVAVTMGRRHGRDSYWSWATMALASMFTAAVAYYVHSSVGIAAALLFMAQAAVMFVYSQHLAQPRKDLTAPRGTALPLPALDATLGDYAAARGAEPAVQPQVTYPQPVMTDLTDGGRLARCRHCGEMIPRGQLGPHGRNVARIGRCVR